MDKTPAKAKKTEDLKNEAAAAFEELAEQAVFFRINKEHYPTDPIYEPLNTLVSCLEQLQARGEKVPQINLSVLPEEFLMLNDKTRALARQLDLKKELLEKHGRQKLDNYRRRRLIRK